MAVDGQVGSGPRAVLIDTASLVVPCSFVKAVALFQLYSLRDGLCWLAAPRSQLFRRFLSCVAFI